ncbi:TIGR01777 family oxidoreductase [Porphyromonas gingivalis]|uniref:TIGR01777 family oxidoreductase n=1 Tax=Porphyromonas gingivalis TaxID=837 RepID=UPI001B8D58B4|nr:TIGR01777 family oxidoreductase [Porphyromonas gingivalis]
MQKDVVLITGANGMVARALSEELVRNGYSIRILTRHKQNENEYEWDVAKRRIEVEALQGVKHIIHLAGAGVADKPWTSERKEVIRSSRIDSARLLLETLKANDIRIATFISASAVGFYGTLTGENIFAENDKNGGDFLSHVCSEWERVGQAFSQEGVSGRTVIMRNGIILAPQGGALVKMVRPVRWFVGAPLGSGKQYMPWIHISDVCGIILHALRNPTVSGIYNVVAPEHVRNAEFMRAIGRAIGRPVLFPSIPKWVICRVFGERASILLEGSRVSAEKIISSGYRFKYVTLEKALDNLLR